MATSPHGPEFRRRDRCLQHLRTAFWSDDGSPRWTIEPIGGSANGFCTEMSDLDVTCCASLWDGDMEMARIHLAMFILPKLKMLSAFHVVEEVFSAKVPIVRLLFEEILEVDLSCYNTTALKNTRLLKAYADIDPAVREFGVDVKRWAKNNCFGEGSKLTLSSYTFTLLAIYFLQVHPAVKLPCLPVDAFEDGGMSESDERVVAATLNWRHTRQCYLPNLRDQFFGFYSGQAPQSFRWGVEVISVRMGCRMSSCVTKFATLRGITNWRLHIEDPYQLERNLHCSVTPANEVALWRAILMESASVPSEELLFSFTEGLASSNTSPGVWPLTAATGCGHTDVCAMPIMLPLPVAISSHIASFQLPCASDHCSDSARGYSSPDTSPGSDTEVELDSVGLIAELNNCRCHFKRVLKPLKTAKVSKRMLHPSMIEARMLVCEACQKTQRFFERKINDRTEHCKDWGLNFQPLYVEFCNTLSMYPDFMQDFKDFKDRLSHQRGHIWKYFQDASDALQFGIMNNWARDDVESSMDRERECQCDRQCAVQYALDDEAGHIHMGTDAGSCGHMGPWPIGFNL